MKVPIFPQSNKPFNFIFEKIASLMRNLSTHISSIYLYLFANLITSIFLIISQDELLFIQSLTICILPYVSCLCISFQYGLLFCVISNNLILNQDTNP